MLRTRLPSRLTNRWQAPVFPRGMRQQMGHDEHSTLPSPASGPGWMASFGQTWVQALQSTHRLEIEAFFSGAMETACRGQASTHNPQPTHVSQSTIISLSPEATVESLPHFLICVHLYYLPTNSENSVNQTDVGAAPCGRPQDGQPLGVAPTISVNNVGFPHVWLQFCRAGFI